MTRPLVSAPSNSIYASYWKTAPQGDGAQRFDVLVARDVDLEEGAEPRVDATFDTLAEAEAYIAKWQPIYPEYFFLLG